MLKNKISKLQKEVMLRYPRQSEIQTKAYKYTLEDWTDKEIRAAVFPEGRDFFDPVDQDIINKWDQTDWLHSGFLKRLSVEELRTLQTWMEKREKERGVAHFEKQNTQFRKKIK